MGSEHSGKRIQYPIHEPNLDYGPHADVTSAAEQKKVNQGSQPSFNRRSGISTGQTCNRGNTTSAAGVLQSDFYNFKKDWRPPPSSRFEKAQSARGGAKLQDGDFILCLPDDPPKRLSYIFGSSGCVHAHSNIQ
ncbi:hypothetical protein BB561_006731 [Smittium simulii]|uniref:Uncharacterized protein n=1 Tax=Smittium simulii TaxID=133385 RepID=A0A2T9Y1Z8_9FUNG|nr:hypothetical protein BB561_006731 [Smittium simulii]